MKLFKKIILGMLSFGITMVYANNENLSLTDLTHPILLKNGQTELVIRLKSNRTTGYRWFLKEYDADFFSVQTVKYIAPSDQNLIGAAGIEEFKFMIKPELYRAPRLGSITLVYGRPWDTISVVQPTVITWTSPGK